MEAITFSAIPGLQVGHAQDIEAATGCTVVLLPQGAVCGVDQRGGAPGTRETDLLRPMHRVQQVHAILLTGGSAFGLAAADGVVRWLEERDFGLNVGPARVPIVPAAVLFDLGIGRADVRPNAAMGYAACQAAGGPEAQRTGSVGAGTGATVGKLLGPDVQMKGGLGSAVIQVTPGLLVGALIAVNCFGNVVDPDSGQVLAGARRPGGGLVGAVDALYQMSEQFDQPGSTVIGVIATNGQLSKEAANKVAQMAQDGLARAIRPAHTMFDGDTLFAAATGQGPAIDVNVAGAFAAEAAARAIVEAVQSATSLAGVPARRDLQPGYTL